MGEFQMRRHQFALSSDLHLLASIWICFPEERKGPTSVNRYYEVDYHLGLNLRVIA